MPIEGSVRAGFAELTQRQQAIAIVRLTGRSLQAPSSMNAGLVADNSLDACPVCRHPVDAVEHRCRKCGRRLVAPSAGRGLQDGADRGKSRLRVVSPAPEKGQAAKAAGNHGVPRTATRRRDPAFPAPLRRKLSEQVQVFQMRRMRPGLPFPSEELRELEKVAPIAAPDAPQERKQPERSTVSRTRDSRSRTPFQNPLVFSDDEAGLPQEKFSAPPVASFRVRVLTDCLDCAWILAAVALFLAPLPLLAEEVILNRYIITAGLGITCVAAFLYGVVFLYLAGATPAMRHSGLRLVNFDGQPATRPERLWRLFGSVPSAGSFLLGFLWAAMDDEKFSWHDRISRTFLTTLPFTPGGAPEGE